jgi:hypothetical protein
MALFNPTTTANSSSQGGGTQLQQEDQQNTTNQTTNVNQPNSTTRDDQSYETQQEGQRNTNFQTTNATNFNQPNFTTRNDQSHSPTPAWLEEEYNILNLHPNHEDNNLQRLTQKYNKNVNVLIARLRRINETAKDDPTNAQVQLTRLIIGWRLYNVDARTTTTGRYKASAHIYLIVTKFIDNEMSHISRTLLRRHVLDNTLKLHQELLPVHVQHLWTQAIDECIEEIPHTQQSDYKPHIPSEVLQYIYQRENATTCAPYTTTSARPTTTTTKIRRHIDDDDSVSTNSSLDDDQDTDASQASIDHYNHNGDSNGILEYETSSNCDRKTASKQAYKLSSIHKKLHQQAKSHQLATFSVTRGTINQRKAFFRAWIQSLRQIFMFHPRFTNLLQHYPLIDPSNMSKTSCM